MEGLKVGGMRKTLFVSLLCRGLLRRVLGTAALLLVFLDASPALAQQRFAVVVGHNAGLDGEEVLRFAERDARRMMEVLKTLGGVEERDAWLLIAPRRKRVKDTLAEVAARLKALPDGGRSALLIFYFAGHGDANNLHLGSQTLEREWLLSALQQMDAALRILITDACQTLPAGRTRGVSVGPSFDIGWIQPAMSKGLVVIHSSQKGEPAHESDTLEGALFTHYLMSGMRGAADADRNGQVSLAEAYSFAQRQTVRRSAGEAEAIQHPSYDMELSGSGELVLTEPQRSRAILLLPLESATLYLVFHQPSGTLLAEAISSPEYEVQLAVLPGRLFVKRRSPKRVEVAEVNLPFGGRRSLDGVRFVEKPADQLASRGGRLDLHPQAWSAGYQVWTDRIASSWILRHGPALAYRLHLGRLSLGLDGAAGFASYDQAAQSHREWAVSGLLSLGSWLDLGITTLDFGVGRMLQWVQQTRERLDAAALGGLQGIETRSSVHRALGAGGGLQACLRVPLSGPWELWWIVEVGVLAFVLEERSGSGVKPVGQGSSSLRLGSRF